MEVKSQKNFQDSSFENLSEPERHHYSYARKALTSHSIHGSITRNCLLESCYFCADLETIDGEISTAYEHIFDLIERREQIIRKPTHDPLISRLPIEVLSLIFIFVKQAYDDDEAYDFSSGEPHLTLPRCSPPLLTGAVCKKWRAISLGTPQLWTDIKVDLMKPGDAQIDMVNEWARRSGALALNPTIFVDATHSNEICNDVVPALRSLANRWNNVALQVPWSFVHELLDDLEVTPPTNLFHIFVLEDEEHRRDLYVPIKLQHPFNPKYLYVCNISITNIPFQLNNLVHLEIDPTITEDVLDLIHQAQNLRNFVAQGYLMIRDPPTAQITNRSLTHLHITAKILQHLTLPSLQHLNCDSTNFAEDSSSLAEFIRRSRPPLHTFVLWSRIIGWHSVSAFEKLPEITSLTINYFLPANPPDHSVGPDPFLHTLVQLSTEAVLPRLREFIFFSPSMPSSSWSLIGRLFKKETQTDTSHVKEMKFSPILGRPLSKVHVFLPRSSEMDEDTFMHLLAVRKSGVDLAFAGSGKDLFREMAGRYNVEL